MVLMISFSPRKTGRAFIFSIETSKELICVSSSMFFCALTVTSSSSCMVLKSTSSAIFLDPSIWYSIAVNPIYETRKYTLSFGRVKLKKPYSLESVPFLDLVSKTLAPMIGSPEEDSFTVPLIVKA